MTALIFLVSSLLSGVVTAEEKLSLKLGGTIQHVDTKKREITFRDNVEKYSSNLRVMAANGRLLGGASFLKSGLHVTYRKTKSGKRTDPGTIIEIWISGQ